MICFEVHRNGEKLRTAGAGEYGILRADLMWLSHEHEKPARWAAEGRSELELVTLDLTVSGGVGAETGLEHWDWVKEALTVGDEVCIRVMDLPDADAPGARHVDAVPSSELVKQYVRERARAFGWEIRGDRADEADQNGAQALPSRSKCRRCIGNSIRVAATP